MSYDIRIEDIRGNTLGTPQNYTSNVAEAYNLCGLDIGQLDGLEAQYASVILSNAMVRMLRIRPKVEKAIPKNGWGTFEGALEFLALINKECAEYGYGIVRVDE